MLSEQTQQLLMTGGAAFAGAGAAADLAQIAQPQRRNR
jgi:hypothetical protein